MEQKVVIVTGASRGIGREIASLLAKEGNRVIANYNQSFEAACQLKNELEEMGTQIDIFKCDVSKREEVRKMVDFAMSQYGRIDVLVNNAGIDQVKLFTDITDEDWNWVMQNNLYSVFCCSQEVAKHMINQQSGLIVNISSIFGRIGGACESHYSCSKAAIDGLTKSLAKELALSHIRVNSIAPGLIDTDMNKDIDYEEVKKEIPLAKIGMPKDIAKCVKWLVEDDYTTGQIIEINGGWNM